MREEGWQELEWQSCSLLSKVAAPVPLGRRRADFGRPQIWELGGKFGCAPIRLMTRLGLFCHAMPGLRPLLPDFPWRRERQMTPGTWTQSHGLHLDRNKGAIVILSTHQLPKLGLM